MSDVNSRDYWNHRFETDWTLRRGCEQSRFFARIALGLMPDWLVRVLRDGATICDWGCAMGDGTAALAAALPGAKFTGIDFSAAAIEHARREHPTVEFVCRDLLQEPPTAPFDVMFSSNVLEHFPRPAEVLARLAPHTGSLMVHLVPFREPLAGREPEHVAGFEWQDLKLRPLPGWRLVHAAATDVRHLPDSLWSGEQVLLVHVRDDHALDLDLASVRIDSRAGELQIASAAEQACRVRIAQLEASAAAAAEAVAAERAASAAHMAELRRRVEQLEAEGQEIGAMLGRTQVENARLDADLRAARDEVTRTAESLRLAVADLTAIRNSRIWRWTAPIRRDGRT